MTATSIDSPGAPPARRLDDADQRVATRAEWKRMALPTEHGGWSLTAEPALLGLAVGWSISGLALACAAMIAFLARTPLKLALVDLWRHRWLDRTGRAASLAAAEIVVGAVLVVVAVGTAERSFLASLALAAPLIAVELWYDMRSRGRRLVPELAGAIGIGSVATAVALAGGVDPTLAWGLWCVIAARSVAAIPYVRTQIARMRAVPARRWHSDVAQLAALLAVVAGYSIGGVPAASVLAIAALAAVNVGAVRLPPKPAKVIGFQQLFYGIGVITVTAAAIHLG